MVKRQVIGHIHEGLINGIHMDILFGNILEINAVNLRSIINIQLHPRLRHDIVHTLRDLKYTAPVMYSKGFHGRGYGKTDGLLRAFWVSHHQPGCHGVQSPLSTLHGSIKGF